MKMKGIDIFCASQASTAICLSMDQASSSTSSSSTIQLGGRAIDRHNPIIKDARRSTSSRTLPIASCSSSQSPINPKAYHQLQKTNKKISSSSPRPSLNHQTKKKIPSSSSSKENEPKRKSIFTSHGKIEDNIKKFSSVPSECVRKQSSANLIDLITPPGSTRYLLSDTVIYDGFSDNDPVLAEVPVEHKKNQISVKNNENEAAISSSIGSSSSSSLSQDLKPPPPSNQVVVLRVSLHCKGCEGKLRKHLKRMEGVTSFNIDFAAKKVTVAGDVTPLTVLASVSKVKNAQFWPTVAEPDPTKPEANK